MGIKVSLLGSHLIKNFTPFYLKFLCRTRVWRFEKTITDRVKITDFPLPSFLSLLSSAHRRTYFCSSDLVHK